MDTHSDPEESPSTVPDLILRATPFSWSGREVLAGPDRPSLEVDPCGDAVPWTFPRGSLCTWLAGQLLSTMGDSCFLFRMPAVEENSVRKTNKQKTFNSAALEATFVRMGAEARHAGQHQHHAVRELWVGRSVCC